MENSVKINNSSIDVVGYPRESDRTEAERDERFNIDPALSPKDSNKTQHFTPSQTKNITKEELDDLLKNNDLELKKGQWLEIEKDEITESDDSDEEMLENDDAVDVRCSDGECWTDEGETSEDWDSQSDRSKTGTLVSIIAGGMIVIIGILTVTGILIMLI